MAKAFLTYQGVIYPWQCDHMGHMNVMYYVGKFDEATWSSFSAIGLLGRKMRDDKKGMVPVEQNLQYKAELVAGDVITIHSEVLSYGDKSIKLKHEMRNVETGAIAAITTLTALYFDKAARKSTQLPEKIKTKLESMKA